MFFSACGGRLTAIGRDSPSPITTWDVRTGRVIARQSLEIELPWHLDTAVVTADGQFMIAANGDYTSVWRLEPPCLVASVPLGIAGRALAVSRDGRRFATASSDSEAEQPTLRIWGLPDVTEVRSWNCRTWVVETSLCAGIRARWPPNRNRRMGGCDPPHRSARFVRVPSTVVQPSTEWPSTAAPQVC